MIKKLNSIKDRVKELKQKMESEEIFKDSQKLKKVHKEFAALKKLYNLILEKESLEKEMQASQALVETEKDSELISLARDDLKQRQTQLQQVLDNLKLELLPKDPNDSKDVILEIRAGAGGDEASLFTQEIFEAYRHYALKRGWKFDIISISQGNVGGYKEAIANIKGQQAYSFLKYESGVHRVQRVPKTESQGRIHTSTITVVVLPEVEALEVEIAPEDLRIDVCRSSGAGGQHVNTTDSAVRVVHLPTKIMVYCQQEKSQHANKERALKILYARLWDYENEKIKTEESKKRKEQMGGGDRSQRIRTYNFPQSRATDHRIHFTSKNLSGVMQGEFEELFQALKLYYQAEMLKSEDVS